MRLGIVVPVFFVLHIFSPGSSAWPTASTVSIPLGRVNSHLPSIEYLPSSILHQQHVNRGVRRLARMKGEEPPPHRELWAEISHRLPSHLKKLEFIQELDNAVILMTGNHSSLDLVPSIRNHRTSTTTVIKSTSTALPRKLDLEIRSNDIGYIARVELGTPPRNFSLLIDSGSADFWVGGEGCRAEDGQSCGNHTYLGSNSSSTFKNLHKPWTIRYNTGEVSGTIVRDDITVADLHQKGFEFGVASIESSEFTGEDVPFDGLAGLARSAISRQQTLTLVESFRKSGVLKNAIVSLKIPRLADGKHDGEMTLGGMNPAKYNAASSIVVRNINQFGFWETPISQVKIGGKPIGWTNRTGILDTGTALILAPSQDVDAIHSQISGAKKRDGSWTVPCRTKASLSLTIGKVDFPIDPRDLAFIPLDSDDTEGDCWSGIGAGTVGLFQLQTTWLLGDTFLKNVYHSMNGDEGKNEIMFAKLG